MQIAFVTTTTITITAVLLCYLLDALDDDLNFLDRRIVDRIQTKCAIFQRCLMGDDNDLVRRASCSSREDIHELWEVRKEAISRFILALSDTQLVTGLAVLLAGACNRKSIMVYELHIILSQAWLASTTHLATLDALRNHLRSYGIIRDIRVACMTILQLLLAVAFCFVQADWDWCALVSSEFQKESSETRSARSTDSGGKKFDVNNAAWVAVLLLIFWNSFIRIHDLYVNQRHILYLPSSLVWRFKQHSKAMSSHSQRFAELVAASRPRRIVKIPKSSGVTRTFLKAVHGYESSFLSSIPGIYFCFCNGVTWDINISSKKMRNTLDIKNERNQHELWADHVSVTPLAADLRGRGDLL